MLSFDEASHTYTYGGLIKPSVTQVLDLMGYVSPFCKSETAATLGTELHALFEYYDKGVLIEKGLPDIDVKCLEMYKSYKNDVDPTFTDIETVLYDQSLDVCGKLDRAGIKPDFIMDIKTGSSVPESARLQTAAYAMMRFPLTYEDVKRYCLHINPKLKTYKIKSYDNPNDYLEWENICRNYWRKIADMKPDMSY